MEISMDKEIADFSVADSNKLRKSIAKFLASCMETCKIMNGQNRWRLKS